MDVSWVQEGVNIHSKAPFDMQVLTAQLLQTSAESIPGHILELVNAQRFGVEYQPIVDTRSGEIKAYEALARFYAANGDAVSPLQVFEALHFDHRLLARTELALKKIQLSEAPRDHTVFINIDPHAVECDLELDAPQPCELMLEILRNQNLVVELIENSDIHEARKSLRISQLLKQQGIKTALDDIGADHSLLSLDILLHVDYLKLDRSWLTKLARDDYEEMLTAILVFAGNSGKQTVLEGIETEHHLGVAKMHGIQSVQGFLFREKFIEFKP